MKRTRSCSRRGAALIITLIILLALMVMGLPFLFSQSLGLSGSRSFQSAQASHIYGNSARNLGAAIITYGTQDYWLTGNRHAWTAMKFYLKDFPSTSPLLPANVANNMQQIPIDPAALTFNDSASRAVIGVSISDESGRISANTLGPQGWSEVLKAAKITDWDDAEQTAVITYPAPAPGYPEGHDDGNTTGQLVDAIIMLRMRHGPFTKLDDLLAADPRQLPGTPNDRFRPRLTRAELSRLEPFLTFHNPAPGRGFIDFGNIIAECSDMQTPTHYLLSDIPEGLIGNESWIQGEQESNAATHLRSWAYAGSGQFYGHDISFMRNSLTSANAGIFGFTDNSIGGVGNGLAIAAPPLINLNEISHTIHDTARNSGLMPLPYDAWPDTSLPIKTYADLYTQTVNSVPITGGGELLKPFSGQNNLRRERQPASLATAGTFRIHAASTMRDAAGHVAAQESRTTIVQVVPQDHLLEVKWDSQETLEALSQQRWTSAMESRPKPTNRVIGKVPDALPYPYPANERGGLSPTTLPTLADNADSPSNRARPVHLNVEWRSTFGRDKPVASGDELKDSRGLPPESTATLYSAVDADLETEGIILKDDKVIAVSLDGPGTGSTSVGPLARVNSSQEMAGRHLSFWFKPTSNWSASSDVVPLLELRMPAANTATLAVNALGGFNTTEDEVLQDATGHNDQQNYIGLFFDPQPFQAATSGSLHNLCLLALCIAAPSAEQLTAPLMTMHDDINFLTGAGKADLFAGIDENSLAGTVSISPLVGDSGTSLRRNNFSRLLKSNRVMHGLILPATGLEKNRWYHLQVALGTGQPGTVGLLLDGLPGRDLTSVDDSSLSVQVGDRFTVPAILLAESAALPLLDPPNNDQFLKDNYYPNKIEVKAPSILTLAGLHVEDMLPQRGTIRVDDEYIRYYGWATAGGTTGLQNCVRGQRQNTQTDSSVIAYQWPTTQRHEVGALITPGDFHVDLGGNGTAGYLYAGQGKLLDDFGNGDPNPITPIGGTTAVFQWQTWAYFSGGTPNSDPANPQNTVSGGGTITLSPSSNVLLTDWPENGGIVRLLKSTDITALVYYHYDKRVGSNLINLQPIVVSGTTTEATGFQYRGLAPQTQVFSYSAGSTAVPPLVWLVSMTISGDQVTEVDGRPPFPYPMDPVNNVPNNIHPSTGPTMAQITEPTGRCEWVSYQTIVYNSALDQSYLVNSGGWGWAAENTTSNARIARGQNRTAFMGTYPYRVTAFPPDFLSSPSTQSSVLIHDANADVFHRNSVVVPVQTECDVAGHWMESGDVITLIPKIRASTTIRPVQRVVRFASHDGYGRANELPSTRKNYDTKDGYFAFTAGLPHALATQDWIAVCGTGWNANRDWSQGNTYHQPPSCMPRLDAFTEMATAPPTTPASTPKPGAIIFGGGDRRSNGGTARPAGTDLQLDALSAATWPSTVARAVVPTSSIPVSPGVIAFASSTAISYTLSGTGLPTDLYAVANGPAFSCMPTGIAYNDERLMGLVEIDGEVFAFQQLNPLATDTEGLRDKAAIAFLRGKGLILDANTDAEWIETPKLSRRQVVKLVGRALLGSVGKTHIITSEIPAPAPALMPLYAPLRMQMLPIGPVFSIPDADKIDGDWFSFTDGRVFSNDASKRLPSALRAPALVICDADGTASTNIESLFPAGPDIHQNIPDRTLPPPTPTPNPNFMKHHTANWLRGLYNTTEKSWSSSPLPPLAIGWWPRYPSAMPSTTTLTAQHFRSRVYSWAGFPWHLQRMRFDPNDFITAAFDADENQALPLSVEARVMAGAINGDLTEPGAREGYSSYLDWSKLAFEAMTLPSVWTSTPAIFPWNPKRDDADGIEVRFSWRYDATSLPPSTNPAFDLALPMNRAPVISAVTLRGHAPITVLSSEESR